MLAVLFFNHTTTAEIYTLSLLDALPILPARGRACARAARGTHVRRAVALGLRLPRRAVARAGRRDWQPDRKSTRLNSSQGNISYAVFCLKKKNHKSMDS